jgi:hypothetical protein
MTEKMQIMLNILNSTELEELLGPPPVLSTENVKAYDEILARIVQSFMPVDFMEQMLIKQLADCMWDIERYVRHKSLSIECKHRELRERQARHAKTLAQRKDAQKNKLAVPEPATALGRMSELEITIDDSVKDVDAILEKPATALDHARALEASIVYHLQLDHAYCTAIARRDDTLEQIERYHRSNRRSDRCIDEILFEEVAEPTLVPSKEGNQ